MAAEGVTDTQVYCLGRSEYGEGSSSHFCIRSDPVKSISCGDAHSAVITAQGRLFVFGKNEWGQLGLGHKNKVNKPTHAGADAFNGEKIRAVSCGRYHTIAITESGKLFGSGSNSEGQLGIVNVDATTTFLQIPVPSGLNFVSISCGADHCLALTDDGLVYGWGSGSAGQLGLGTKGSPTPKIIKFKQAKRITRVSCGYYHSICVSDKNEIFAFGETDNGKLGLGELKEDYVTAPTKVTGIDGTVLSVSCGSNHSVIVTSIAVYAWGDGSKGQLGLSHSVESSSTPMRLGWSQKEDPVTMAVCGENHTALVTQDMKLLTFGCCRYDPLGLKSDTDVFEPRLVEEIAADWNVLEVACGGCHTLAIVSEKPISDDEDRISTPSDSDAETQPSSLAASLLSALPPNIHLAPPALSARASTDSNDDELPVESSASALRPTSARQRRRELRSLEPISGRTQIAALPAVRQLEPLKGGLPRLGNTLPPIDKNGGAGEKKDGGGLAGNLLAPMPPIRASPATPLSVSESDPEGDDISLSSASRIQTAAVGKDAAASKEAVQDSSDSKSDAVSLADKPPLALVNGASPADSSAVPAPATQRSPLLKRIFGKKDANPPVKPVTSGAPGGQGRGGQQSSLCVIL